MTLHSIIDVLASAARGFPFILILVGSAIYLTIRLRGIQFRKTGLAFHYLVRRSDDQEGRGEVSNFGAMATVLSGTIGTGNIAGVATAITLGGPGAIFWMWMTALFGMALKYACCLLGHHFRRVDANGEIAGGPMYTLKYGLNMPKMGAFFAIATLLAASTTGGMVQAHSVVDGILYVMPQFEEWRLGIAVAIAFLVGIVILGGVQRIATVASVVVPFMAVAYCGAALVILLMNLSQIPAAFMMIFEYALNPWSVGSGMLGAAIQFGVLRALFASEAGLGTAPIALAATRTNYSVRAGLIGMIGPWFDTMLICTMTALVIIVAGFHGAGIPEGLVGASLSAAAFEQGLANAFGPAAGVFGAIVVGAGLVFFAYTTMIAWAYYGDRATQFLFGAKAVTPFRLAFVVLTMIGAVSSLELVWALADIANVLMALPNILSLLLLVGMVKQATNDYFADKAHVVPEAECMNPPKE